MRLLRAFQGKDAAFLKKGSRFTSNPNVLELAEVAFVPLHSIHLSIACLPPVLGFFEHWYPMFSYDVLIYHFQQFL